MLAVADQAEIDHLFASSSISDQNLLQAIEILESAQTSVDRTAQTSTASYVIHTTVRVESVGNAGAAGIVGSLQRGKFYTDCIFTICIPASPADIGRKLASPAHGSR